MRDEVTVSMTADPARVWALVSDVTRIGEFSPETFEGEWLGGATGPAKGAEFRGHVKRTGTGVVYWTKCRVTACEPEREFAFEVRLGKGVANRWGYRITPTDSGCDVTEWFALPNSAGSRIYWKLFGRGRGRTNRQGMRETLERIKAVVEKQPAA